MDFGASWYFMDERDINPVDKLFISVLQKVDAYRHHTATTTELYRREEKMQRDQIKHEYDRQMEIARPKYQQILKENEGEEWADSFASHESGVDAIQYFHYDEDEAVFKRFGEITSYFHKSSLALAYALFESELRMLCSLLERQLGKAITLDHLKGGYLEAIWNYLMLVCDVNMEQLETFKTYFSGVGTLRNKIMHNGGVFTTGNVPEEISKFVAANANELALRDNDGFTALEVKEQFLSHVYSKMKLFFYELFLLVDKRLGYELLRERLRYLTAFLSRDIVVTGVKVKFIAGGVTQVQAEARSEKASFELALKLSIAPSAAASAELIDQDSNVPEVARLKAFLERNPSLLLDKILGPYSGIENRTVKATLIVYPL